MKPYCPLSRPRLLALALSGILPGAAWAGPDIVDLGTLGGAESRAVGINAAGVVVGTSGTANGGLARGFVYSRCRMTEIVLGGYVSPGSANAVNDAGLVVGADNDVEDFYVYAYLWQDGAIRSLGIDGSGVVVCGSSSAALAVSGNGAVAGWRDVSTLSHEAFLYRNGSMTGLGSLGGGWSEAYGINDAGQIVGAARDVAGRSRPFLYQAGTLSELGGLGGREGAARAINAAGLAAGWADTPTERHAVVWRGKVPEDLGQLGGGWSEAQGLNGAGDVVGWSRRPGGDRRAFLYRNGRMQDLNDLLPPGSGWVLTEANGINERGQIVGEGINPEGRTRAFLWSPEPVPACPPEPTPPPNLRPVADAGAGRTASVGSPVMLDGSASRDPDGGPDPLRYRWRTVSAPVPSGLARISTANPEFTPTAAGAFVFELVAADGRDESLPVRVTILAEPPPPQGGPAPAAPAQVPAPVPVPSPATPPAGPPATAPAPVAPAVPPTAPESRAVAPEAWATVRPDGECASRRCLKTLARARADLRNKARAAIRTRAAAAGASGKAPALAARKSTEAARAWAAFETTLATVRRLRD